MTSLWGPLPPPPPEPFAVQLLKKDQELAELRAQLLSVQKERDNYQRSLTFHRDQQACRWETHWHWGRTLPEPYQAQFFSIAANGSSSPEVSPIYSQRLNTLRGLLAESERKNKKLTAQVEEFREISHDACNKMLGHRLRAEELERRNAECEAAVDQAVAVAEYLDGHSKGAMAERVKTALSTPFAVERATELTRLRAVEAAANRVCDEADATGTPGWPSVQKLAEACGRKG